MLGSWFDNQRGVSQLENGLSISTEEMYRATPSSTAPARRFGGLAGVPSHGGGLVQGFALISPFPYTYPFTRRSIISEGADHGNAHDIPLG